jgi:hypothetical protein
MRLPTEGTWATPTESGWVVVSADSRSAATREDGQHFPLGVSAAAANRGRRFNDGLTASTGRSILIGMLSAFGSAALVVVILGIVYFFRYTRPGRIFLDRMGRPGEYDDEAQFAKEEAEALEAMDDMQRMEYFRAKGTVPSTGIDHESVGFDDSSIGSIGIATND